MNRFLLHPWRPDQTDPDDLASGDPAEASEAPPPPAPSRPAAPSASRPAPDPRPATATFAAAAHLAAPLLTSSAPGVVGTGGDTALHGPAARSQFRIDGTGLRIGIVSDSFDAATATGVGQPRSGAFSAAVQTEQSNGDLPNVVVLTDTAAGQGTSAADEGREMAELIHKIAPGAQIYFAAASDSEFNSATAVRSLIAAGVNVIVDDVSWDSEPFFQDGGVLQAAVAAATAAGITYVTSAGNAGSHYYQSSIAARTAQTIAFSGGAVQIQMQWSQPFRSISNVGTPYSLSWQLLVHGTPTVAYASTTNKTGADPIQSLSFSIVAGTYDFVILADHGAAVPTDQIKVLFTAPNPSAISMTPGSGSGSVFGHALVASADVVGAVDSASPTTVEAYSATGPGTEYYAATGAAIAPTPLGKPDFLAPDRIATSLGTFSGTSAAAPNAAAVAALLLQINPNLTPAALQTILRQTASVVGLTGNSAQFGAGLVDAAAAAALIYDGQFVTASGTLLNGPPGAVRSIQAWHAGSGAWTTAADWATGAIPTATSYVTLGDDRGSLAAPYTVTLAVPAGSIDSLTVGAATSTGAAPIAAGLTLAAAAALTVAGGATIGRAGSLTLAGSLTVNGLLRLDDVTGATALLTVQPGGSLGAGALAFAGGVLRVAGIAAVTADAAIGAGASLVVTGHVGINGTISGPASLANDIEIGSQGRLAARAVANSHVTIAWGGTLEIASAGTDDLQNALASIELTRAPGTGPDLYAHIALTGLAYSAGNSLVFYDSFPPFLPNPQVYLMNGATTVAIMGLDPAGPYAALSTVTDDGHGHPLINIACYREGTRIATPTGDRPVESFQIGDLVATASGPPAPIRWIGRRRYSAAETAAARRLRPIEIAAGALGPGLPRRPLHLSPQHALLLDGLLVPAALLVNGRSIRRSQSPGPVAYVHIELDRHDALLAEGQPAESFADHASRAGFDNAADHAAGTPNPRPPAPHRSFAPRIEGGTALRRLRAGIAARANLHPGRLEACLDRADAHMIEGWAWEPDNPHGPVLLEILVAGTCVKLILADQYRADLRAMNGGDCAFFFPVPDWLLPDWITPGAINPADIAVRRAADGHEIRRPAARPVMTASPDEL